MNELAYISKESKKFIDNINKVEYTVVHSRDILFDINQFIEDYEDKNFGMPPMAVLFVTFPEYIDIYKSLELFTNYDIIFQFVLFGSDSDLNSLTRGQLHYISEFRKENISNAEFNFILKKAFAAIYNIYSSMSSRDEYLIKLIDTRQDQEDLIDIGRALSSEKDLDDLLKLILTLSKKITGADSGNIFLVEQANNGRKKLKFKCTHTFSADIPIDEFEMDMNKNSIVGYVATTGRVLNIPDVYNLPEDSKYSYSNLLDEKNNYICRSMLVVPMKNYAGEIIGVIQLINSKEQLGIKKHSVNEAFSIKLNDKDDVDKFVVPFSEKYDTLLEAIAGQAAISIENNRLINQIQMQFEEFVKASVNAVESRDPATSGHSFRVAEVCKEMVKAINTEKTGFFKEMKFSINATRELELAALLHDFGKIYISLATFKKSKKLFPVDLENLILRLKYLYRYIELDYSLKEVEVIKNHTNIYAGVKALPNTFCHNQFAMKISEPDSSDFFHEIENLNKKKNSILQTILDVKKKIEELNEPTIEQKNQEFLIKEIEEKIKQIDCFDIDGEKFEIFTENTRTNLTITKGSLNEFERKEIESHVMHTYNFVSKIPWPPEYKNIPEITLKHHEKIDGSGYPHGIEGKDKMSIQSRIMAIADIYDALIASDRPYKIELSKARVLKILKEEAKKNKIDKELVSLFIKHKIYEKIDKDSFKIQ